MPRFALALLIAATCLGAADDEGVLVVKGLGAEGRVPYGGGGKVVFTAAWLPAQVFHYAGSEEMPLQLGLQYEVLEPAPIMLTTDMGTEYWRLYHYATEDMSALYTDEKVDLSAPGPAEARTTRARVALRYGAPPAKGLCAVSGRSYFLVRQPDGPWLDVVNPPAFFDLPPTIRGLVFTLANLDRYELRISQLQSTWEPGGPLRVQVTITDADGETFPVVNCALRAKTDDWESELATEWGPLNEPTGWMRGRLPEGRVPEQITVVGTVELVRDYTGDGVSERLERTVGRGEGQLSAEQIALADRGYELPRNANGVIRETRALWVSLRALESRSVTDNVIERAQRARLNMLVPLIFLRNRFAARNDLGLPSATLEDGGDPLAYFLQQAHAAGLEVHPWYCTAYRDRNFRAWFEQKYGVSVDVISVAGKVYDEPADLHRPEYRDFIVQLMVGVTRDYEVDGIHHDYIRVMQDCYCENCRAQFQEQFGKPLSESTEQERGDWHRQAVGDIVRRIAEGVRAVRPEARLSAAVFADMLAGALQGQDPAGWAQQGWLDLVIPMDYAMQTLQVRATERRFLEALGPDYTDRLVTGLSLYQRSGQNVSPRSPELVVEQIELVRRMGIHGYCLFVSDYLSEEIVTVLAEQINREPAVPYFR